MALKTAIKRAIDDHTSYKAVKVVVKNPGTWLVEGTNVMIIGVEVIKKPKAKKK